MLYAFIQFAKLKKHLFSINEIGAFKHIICISKPDPTKPELFPCRDTKREVFALCVRQDMRQHF